MWQICSLVRTQPPTGPSIHIGAFVKYICGVTTEPAFVNIAVASYLGDAYM